MPCHVQGWPCTPPLSPPHAPTPTSLLHPSGHFHSLWLTGPLTPPTTTCVPPLQRFFSRYEFSAPHLLCCSDCEAVPMAELLALADGDSMQR